MGRMGRMGRIRIIRPIRLIRPIGSYDGPVKIRCTSVPPTGPLYSDR
jgi:hypothetical protein